jgi:hypothetical protein
MLEERGQLAFSRRGLFLFAGAGLASWSRMYGFGGKEFWEAKDPGEWNSDEIAKLLSKSPWAKQTTAESVKTQKNSMPGSTTAIPNTMPGSRSSRNNGGLGRCLAARAAIARNPPRRWSRHIRERWFGRAPLPSAPP